MAQETENNSTANGDNAVESAIAGVKSETLKDQLRSETDPSRAIAMAQEIKSTQGIVSWAMAGIIAAFIVALIVLLIFAPNDSVLTNAAASRPILMLIVILTTAIFGGALINGAVFKKVDKDQFSNGREIFLFFSGISATVIGFYFGSATTEGLGSAPADLSVEIEDGGTIAVRTIGEQTAWSARLVVDARALEMVKDATDDSRFTLAVSERVCPAGGAFEISGPAGLFKKSFAVSFSSEELLSAGWSKCSLGDEGDGDQSDAETS